MARLPRIRLAPISELTQQLRFSPRAAAARQVAAALALSLELDPNQAYPEAWVLQRITGFHKEIAEPVLLVGAALIADLSAFAEAVSARAELQTKDIPGALIAPNALAQRWNISSRTLDRYRRRGLIAVRVLDAHSMPRLAYLGASVEHFERSMSSVLTEARNYSRIDPDLRNRVVAAGRAHRAATGASLARTASAVAQETGVSPNAAGRALRAQAQEHFGDSKRPDPKERRVAFRAWSRGIGPAEIADRLGLTRAGAHRLINSERAAFLRTLELSGPASPRFASPKAADVFLQHSLTKEGLGAPGDVEAVELAAASRLRIAPDATREKILAEALHFLRWRATRSIRALKRIPGGEPIDEVETDLRWASLLKIELIRGERPLIVRSIEERAGMPLLDLSPQVIRAWCAVAFRAASEGADRYDPFKRGRLATPISLALARGLAGLETPAPTRRARPTTLPIDDWARGVDPWSRWLAPSRTTLPHVPRDVRILGLRYGGENGPPLTLLQLQRLHSISPVQVWRAMAR